LPARPLQCRFVYFDFNLFVSLVNWVSWFGLFLFVCVDAAGLGRFGWSTSRDAPVHLWWVCQSAASLVILNSHGSWEVHCVASWACDATI
jgi:hypothetical protein